MPWKHWSILSYQVVSIIATVFFTIPQTLSWEDCNNVLNAAARLISNKRKLDHITPVLRDQLHWLPICQWIDGHHPQRPPWLRSDIPQLQSCPRRSAPGLTCGLLYEASNQDPSLWAQKLPCLGTGCLELTSWGHSKSGTVARTFQIYVENSFVSPSICSQRFCDLVKEGLNKCVVHLWGEWQIEINKVGCSLKWTKFQLIHFSTKWTYSTSAF